MSTRSRLSILLSRTAGFHEEVLSLRIELASVFHEVVAGVCSKPKRYP